MHDSGCGWPVLSEEEGLDHLRMTGRAPEVLTDLNPVNAALRQDRPALFRHESGVVQNAQA